MSGAATRSSPLAAVQDLQILAGQNGPSAPTDHLPQPVPPSGAWPDLTVSMSAATAGLAHAAEEAQKPPNGLQYSSDGFRFVSYHAEPLPQPKRCAGVKASRSVYSPITDPCILVEPIQIA